MQNADSTVSSPAPSGHGFKRKRSGSLNSGLTQGVRPKKVPREIAPELELQDDADMEDVVSSPPPIDGAIRVNGTSSVAGAAAIAAATKALSDSEEWQRTIERIVKSVVAIRFCQVSAFDTEPAMVSEATGFIVDVVNGYILTNRHVVGSGPFVGHIVCENHEEADVFAIYRDPIHDFGFLKFDPSKIRYMKVQALPLRPDLAKVGVEIRVVGNDSGEKLSILAGWISRMDRNAPDYGELTYNDFNTNYFTTAANASGGSSGSPVINIDGAVVALQAGGVTLGATDFFLPLDRVQRALRCLQQGVPISRGTIQTAWSLRPFDECKRLGLTPEHEGRMRALFPDAIGLLLAETVLPKGPSDKLLEEGDMLLKVNDEYVNRFIRLEELLDESVGQLVKILVQRGFDEFEYSIKVGDKHAITPDRYVHVCGARFNTLSYQLARAYNVPVQGVYVCEQSGSFRLDSDGGFILESVNHFPTPTLDAFIEIMKTLPDRARITVTARDIRDMHILQTGLIQLERHWSSEFKLWVRNDKTGLWDSTDLGKPPPRGPVQPITAKFISLSAATGPAVDLIRCFVRVSYYIPVRIDGFPRSRRTGSALIVDSEKGLAVVSRAVVPFDLGVLTLTFAESVIIPGKVEYLHPTLGIAVISWDPSLLGNTEVKSARLAGDFIQQGAGVSFVGFNHNQRIVATKTNVVDVIDVTIPQSQIPRYRAVNVEAIQVANCLPTNCPSGVLADETNRVWAFWLSFLGDRHGSSDLEFYNGLPTPYLESVIAPLRHGQKPNLRIVGCEFHSIEISMARSRGVSENWIERVERASDDRHVFFMVRRLDAELDPKKERVLEEGDIVLSCNGNIVTRMYDLTVHNSAESVQLRLLRKGVELDVPVATVSGEDGETDRFVLWAGALLHAPHRAVRQQAKTLHSLVYISARSRGSPAYQFGLMNTMYITHLNGVPTPDLTAFLNVALTIPDNTYVRVKIVTFDNQPLVLAVKTNHHYFPTLEMIKDPSSEGGWRRGMEKDDEGPAHPGTHVGVSDDLEVAELD